MTTTTTLIVAEELLERLERAEAACTELAGERHSILPQPGDERRRTRLLGKADGVKVAAGYVRDSIRHANVCDALRAATPPPAPTAATLAATTPVAAYATIIATITTRYGEAEARRLIDLCELSSRAMARADDTERDTISAEALAALIAAEATR